MCITRNNFPSCLALSMFRCKQHINEKFDDIGTINMVVLGRYTIHNDIEKVVIAMMHCRLAY